MKTVHTAGGLVINDGKILLVAKNQKFVIPKGHLNDGETKEAAALREVKEETGCIAEIIKYYGALSRGSTEKTGEVVHKIIDLYEMRPLKQTNDRTDEESQWVSLVSAPSQMLYEEEGAFLANYLSSNTQTLP